jgi:hypothetical protein
MPFCKSINIVNRTDVASLSRRHLNCVAITLCPRRISESEIAVVIHDGETSSVTEFLGISVRVFNLRSCDLRLTLGQTPP